MMSDVSRDVVVRVCGLDVSYGWRKVLNDISFELCAGQSLALLGANGAGKTTLLKTIAGAMEQDAGEILFDGDEACDEEIVGWSAHDTFLYDDLTVGENLRFWAAVSDVCDKQKRIDELADFFDLKLVLGERISSLSFGLVKRVSICRAVINQPKLLLLDEAFNGLDQFGLARLFEFLTREQKAGLAVILTSHQIDLALKSATHLAVLDGGNLILSGEAGEFDRDAICKDYLGYAMEAAG